MKALDAIKSRAPAPPKPLGAKARKELLQILRYNDTQTSPQRRVGLELALEVLAAAGWRGTRFSLEKVCQIELKRRGYAKP